jgi:hypothetical protein
MRITIVLVKLVFRLVEGFKMEQRAANKFYVKLKKTTTETFEVLKNAYGEEFYREQVCLNGLKVQRRARVVTRRLKERPSFNFQNRRIDGSHSKVFGRRSKFECSDVRRNDGINRETVRKVLLEDLKKK